MQNIICGVRNCGYCSNNGFCLNRLVSINEQGVCNWLTKPGWDQKIERQFKTGYRWWEEQQEQENAGARLIPEETGSDQDQGLD